MKTKLITAAFVAASMAFIQAETTTRTTKTTESDGSSQTTTSTTTSSGTISEYTPGSTFIMKETSGPVTYRYGKKVTYVTKSGKELSDDDVKVRVKVGSPVHVHYSKDGDARVIDRVEIDD